MKKMLRKSQFLINGKITLYLLSLIGMYEMKEMFRDKQEVSFTLLSG